MRQAAEHQHPGPHEHVDAVLEARPSSAPAPPATDRGCRRWRCARKMPRPRHAACASARRRRGKMPLRLPREAGGVPQQARMPPCSGSASATALLSSGCMDGCWVAAHRLTRHCLRTFRVAPQDAARPVGLGPATHHLGHTGPRPAAPGVAFEAVRGGEELGHVSRPGAMPAFQHRHHGLDLARCGRCVLVEMCQPDAIFRPRRCDSVEVARLTPGRQSADGPRRAPGLTHGRSVRAARSTIGEAPAHCAEASGIDIGDAAMKAAISIDARCRRPLSVRVCRCSGGEALAQSKPEAGAPRAAPSLRRRSERAPAPRRPDAPGPQRGCAVRARRDAGGRQGACPDQGRKLQLIV